jgi:hypothetical protein
MKLVECITSGYEEVVFHYRDMASAEFRSLLRLTDSPTPNEFLFDIFKEPPAMRVVPTSDTALNLRITYVQLIADLSSDSDVLTMPMPLYLAVEEYATAMALKQDRSPDAGAYEAGGDKIIAEMFGAHHRQTQDVEIASGYLDSW